jgi:dihydrofolate synthase / folylpolyglutamate synthase
MTYQETIDWMFAQLPMYQNVGKQAYKADLKNTILFAEYLQNPEKELVTIHVAGTNGKGSTSSMIASILQEAGYKVGLYTSPHLKNYRERIKINGKMISEDFVVDFISKHKTFLETNDLSFFEMTVGLALDYFKTEKVDVAVIEVGMGGRLDSTNIITPIISVITNIGLDHTQFLGNTLQEIAYEKAGIIKPNIPVVIGEFLPETKPVFLEIAAKHNAQIFFASDLLTNDFESDLQGDYQIANRKTALQAIRYIQLYSQFRINQEQVRNGYKNVIKNTGLQGRWQFLKKQPKVICDTAHNKAGLEIVLNQIKKQKFKQLHFVLGVVNDKDLDQILPIFPKKAIYYFCKPNIARGLAADILKNKAAEYGLTGNVFPSVTMAYETAIANAATIDLVFIGGSTFVVAEVL